ncbi:MAG: hypothetical protein GC137_00735 [Alphaproteobacteria bacterium]|nr:hypothetical protein [Alphaproteobacteria bacterium]
MSDPTAINIILTQVAASGTPPPEAQVQNAQILQIPVEFQQLEQVVNIRAEIIRIEANNIVRAQLQQGIAEFLLEKPLNLKPGDLIDIRINRGNPTETAILRPVRTAPPQQIGQPALQNFIRNIPQPISQPLENLITSGPIELKLLTPQQVKGITQPFIEKIEVKPTLSSIFPIIKNEAGQIQVTKTDISAPPSSQFFTLPQAIENKDIPLINVTLQTPETKLPFRFIAAKTLSNQQFEPITQQIQSQPSIIQTIDVRGITPPKISQTIVSNRENATLNPIKAGQISAQIVGLTAEQHFPVLEINRAQAIDVKQHYALQTPVDDAAIGSEVVFTVTKSSGEIPLLSNTLTAPLAPLNSFPASHFLTPEIWQSLQEVQTTLFTTNPATAQAFTAIIPNAAIPQNIGATALLFIAAIRSGDIQSWLGEKATESLKNNGKNNLLSRVTAELGSLNRLNADPISQDWRALSLPLAWQNEIHKIVVHYKRDEDSNSNDSDQKKGSKTRFVMDLRLTNMGKIQLDALFIGDPMGIGRLDLVLHTEQTFSQAMKMQMRQAYKAALDDTKITGELGFQDKKDLWVHITPDTESKFERNV